MSWKDNQLIDNCADIIVYQGATHGEYAGRLSVLITTKVHQVYGCGLNTLVTNSHHNPDYPMREGDKAYLPNWVKVEILCRLNIQKIVVGFGWGAAVTKYNELLMWGKGAPTYLRDRGIEIIELYDPIAACRFCKRLCCDYGRRIGNSFFSYCKQQQTLVKFSSPPPNVQVKRLGNRTFGALVCSFCLKDCDIEVMESSTFNFCNTCNQLWDLDENSIPLNIKSVLVESFVHKLDTSERIRDIAPGQWGIWILSDSNRVRYSASFVHPDIDTPGTPQWWKEPLVIPLLRTPHRIISTLSTKTDVFVITDTGSLYKRLVARNKGIEETHTLRRIDLGTGVKKMRCGRYASLCLLEDGTVWAIYSQKSKRDLMIDSDLNVKGNSNAEELIGGKGAQGCSDIAGISYADLFYVRTSRSRPHIKKKNPLTGNAIEVLCGELDCKTFLWHFSDRCRVSSEGQSVYDVSEVAEIIKDQPSTLQDEEEEQQGALELETESHEFLPSPESIRVSSIGLGFPVGVTLWSSWGSHLRQKAAAGWHCIIELSKRTYGRIFRKTKTKSKPQLDGASSSDTLPPQIILPSFQSKLYGKPKFADLTLHLKDGNFPAHRIVLCSTSKHFHAKLTGGQFDIRSMDMKMYNPRAYRCLLTYFYTIEPNRMEIHDMLDLYLLAKMYDELRIVRNVEDTIKSMITVSNVTKIMEFAIENSSSRLQDECTLFKRNDSAFQDTTISVASPTSALQPILSTEQQE